MSFQSVVITIAVVILILSLIILGILLWNSRNELEYPPNIGDCPDYFTLQKDGSCFNQHGLGNGSQGCKSYNFSDMDKKEKRQWARSCEVTWDGIYNM